MSDFHGAMCMWAPPLGELCQQDFFRRPFRGAGGASRLRGFVKSLMKFILTPPFRSAQHLPCKGGKKG